MALVIGQTLKQRYQLQALLGQGGMGVVYRAYDIVLQRTVAIKVLPPQLTIDAEFVCRFQREAIASASLRHPHIVTVHDVGLQDGEYFIIMEYLEGSTLEQWLAGNGPVPLGEAKRIIDQIASALDHAHTRGIIHRDVKPSNIMLDAQGRAVLMDFGLVRAGEGFGPTRSSIMMGTPQYMAPEQVLGQAIDRRTDIYALGVVIFEMLSGKTPFAHTTPLATAHAHAYEAPPPLRSVNKAVSAPVEAVVMKALAKDPAARYQGAGDLAEDFSLALSGVMPAGLVASSPTAGSRKKQSDSPARGVKTVAWPSPARGTPPASARPGRSRASALMATGALAVVVVLLAVALWPRSGVAVDSPTTNMPAVVVVVTATDTPTQLTRLVPPTETPAATHTLAGVEPITPTASVDRATPHVNQSVLPMRSATATSVPSQTPASTEEAPPTSTPMPDIASILAESTVNLRSGPGTAFGVVGQLNAGQTARILGKNQDGSWWQIERSGADPAWVVARLVSTQGPADQVAMAENIPEPPVVVAPAPAAAAPVAAAPRPTGGGSFGYGVQAHMVHNDQAGKVMQMTKGMGFNWVKQQIQWKVFETSPGQIGWSEMDRLVDVAAANGVNLLFSVVNAPDWARESGFDRSVGGPPADPNTFANFLGQMAGKYCGTSLKAIEIWNEQNLRYEWGNRDIDPNAYMELLKPSYLAIKAACPSMTVISGALTPTGAPAPWAMDDFAYLDGMYRAGLRDYADGIGAHPSGFNVPPDVTWQDACATIQRTGNSFNGPCDAPHHSWSFRSTMEGYRNLMVRYGDANKRIWPTEFGWAAGGAFDIRYPYANDNDFQEQAAWTVEAFQMMKNWGWVGPAFLWNLNFRVVANGTEKAQWGIVDPGWNPLPVYNALANMPK